MVEVPGTRCPVPPTTPGKPGAVTTPGIPILPGSPSSTVTVGESVRPVHTGQKAQSEKADQCLAQSELPVLNSPDRSVQLEHNVHKQPGNMPNLQAEHLSEHSEAFLDFTNSDSPNVKAYKSPECTQLRHSGHRSSVTPATLCRVATVREKSLENGIFSRSGKSQGISILVREI